MMMIMMSQYKNPKHREIEDESGSYLNVATDIAINSYSYHHHHHHQIIRIMIMIINKKIKKINELIKIIKLYFLRQLPS